MHLDESRALVNNRYMRKTEFVNGEYYHIFNRGVDKRKIFQDDGDFSRFWLVANLLNDIEDDLMTQWKNYRRKRPDLNLEMFRRESGSRQKPLVAIVSYCFNPNHFHFILKQVKDNGIKKFMHKIGTSYANYFNEKYDRTGALFEGRFKSIHIKNNSRLLYLSAYVNCNSEIHNIAKAPTYKWCSFLEYTTGNKDGMCDKKIILEQFRSRRDYAEFMKENVQYAKQRKEEEKDFLE